MDTGHFALETHATDIGERIVAFLDPRLSRNAPERDAVAIVSSFYRRLSRGDVPGVLELMDPAIQWTEAKGFPYYSGTWVGPDAVLKNLLQRVAADWTDFAATQNDVIDDGRRVVSFGTYSGIYKRTGKKMSADFAHLWTVANGKLTSFVMYTDTALIREALS